MVLNKICNDQKLECENEVCKSIIEPEEKYDYFVDHESISFHCSVYKRLIFGSDLNKPLFNGKLGCYPRDLFCIDSPRTYIFDKTIIHECPFRKF